MSALVYARRRRTELEAALKDGNNGPVVSRHRGRPLHRPRWRASSTSSASRVRAGSASETFRPKPPRAPQRGGRPGRHRSLWGARSKRQRSNPRPRRAGPAWRPLSARRALPDPLRPDLQLPPHERRQPPRRGGPDDADVREDARVDRALPLAVGAVLGVALPDRPQPRDGPLPRAAPLAAGGGDPRAAGSRRTPPRSRHWRRSATPACSS